jgi:hypothetical protein
MTSNNVTYRSPSYYEVANPGISDWREHRGPEYWEYRRQWRENPADHRAGDFPLHVDIDPTNACNLKCTMCPRTHYLASGNRRWAPDGKIGYMAWDLFVRVIDQASSNGAYSIKMNYLGEPLLHPRIVDMVSYAHTRGLEVMMNTNAVLLTPDLSRRLLEAGLDDIFFSVDSPYSRDYERIRVGARFDQVIDHIGRFVEIKEKLGLRHVQTRASMVIDSVEGSVKARADYQALFAGLGVAEIGFGLATDMNLDYWATYGKIHGFTCPDLYNRLFVFWDGLIGPCCGEWERGYLMGDANEYELIDIWHGERYRRIRSAHEAGRYEDIPICRRCSVPWLSRQEVAP